MGELQAPAVWAGIVSLVGLLLSGIGTLLWWQVRDLRADVRGLGEKISDLSASSAAGGQAVTDLRGRVERLEVKTDAFGPQAA